jgi:uncharacterized Zn-finger protein
MMSENDECSECEKYVRIVSNDRTWTCILCQLTEQTISLNHSEGNIIWTRYELECGHQSHPRCYKVWAKQNQSIGCPYCSLFPKTKYHLFCSHCKNFGHPPTHCPIVDNIILHLWTFKNRRFKCPKV